MTIRAVSATVLAAALTAAPATLALPQEEKKAETKPGAPKMPAPAAEMKELAFFDGNWNCEGTMPPGPMGPGGKMKSTVKSHSDLGGFWQSGVVKGTMEGMPPFEGMFHMTYDPGSKNYVMVWVDNMGAWSQSTSSGWDGDKMVFEGTGVMGGQKVMGRDTFTKGSDGSLKHSAEMQMEGKWVPMGDETCRKGASGKAASGKKKK